MDLKIAAITIVNRSILLTRNSSDFGQISSLSIEDWTILCGELILMLDRVWGDVRLPSVGYANDFDDGGLGFDCRRHATRTCLG